MMLPKIEDKIKSIRKDLALLDRLKPDCHTKFVSDEIYQGALLHYLYRVSDNSISIAEMVIKYKDLPRAKSYYDSIDLLGEYRVIPPDFAYDFAKIASFRNFLAHHYENIDYKMICEKTLDKLSDIEQYLQYIQKYLEQN